MKQCGWWGVLLCLMTGCVTPDRAVVVDLSPAAWSEAVELDYENHNTVGEQNLQLFLRLDDGFAEDSLTLHIATFTPDSLCAGEYHRLVFSAAHVPTPLQRVAVVPYRRGVQLTREGIYRFRLTPTRTVRGIEAIGIKME